MPINAVRAGLLTDSLARRSQFNFSEVRSSPYQHKKLAPALARAQQIEQQQQQQQQKKPNENISLLSVGNHHGHANRENIIENINWETKNTRLDLDEENSSEYSERKKHGDGLENLDDDDDDVGSSQAFISRKGTGYGIALTSPETAKMRFSLRKRLLDARLRVCNWSLAVAVFGLILAMVDCEIIAYESLNVSKDSSLSLVLRWFILSSTLILDILVIMYHWMEVKISLVESGSEYWRVALSTDRCLKLLAELTICSICPLPGTGYLNWPTLQASYTTQRVILPLDTVLCLPMFLRFYILCRFMVLHSTQFQDAATRTIAVLNQIAVDFPFVVKTQLFQRPLALISLFTLVFWLCVAWMLTQCERYTDTATPGFEHMLNYIWFEIVTFFSIGYGDVVPLTYCGRALAITTGIVGTFVSSLIIAIVGKKMQLSLAEKRVNQVIAESQLSSLYKNTAATVLQETWFVHKYGKLQKSTISYSIRDFGQKRNAFKLRIHQRNLLQAILSFRRVRWRLRMRQEEVDDYIAYGKAYMETQERMSDFRRKQMQLRMHVTSLTCKLDQLTRSVEFANDDRVKNSRDKRKTLSVINLNLPLE